MQQKLILENWRKFLKEEISATPDKQDKKTLTTFGDLQKLLNSIQVNKKLAKTGEASLNLVVDQIAGLIPGASNIKTAFDFYKTIFLADDTKKTNTWLDKLNIDDNYSKIVDDTVENSFLKSLADMLSKKSPQDVLPSDYSINKELEIFLKTNYKSRTIQGAQQLEEEKKKKSGDRCTRIAKRKYDVWPSAYASGAVVKCRKGKIWKGVSENASDQEIDDALLLEEIEVLEEKWSGKYKRSIDCKNPKGFSQKAHCQGKKKNEDIDLGEVEIIEEAKKKDYKPNFSKEKEQGLHGWFARNDGKGWVNCRTGGPCGRDSADKGGKYPACRPTKAQCKSAGKGPLRKKKSSSPISWTKKKKD